MLEDASQPVAESFDWVLSDLNLLLETSATDPRIQTEQG